MADIKIIVDSSDVVKADNRIDQLGNSGKVAGKGLGKASRGMNQFGKVSAVGGKKMNTFNMQIQQGGYQLQDFVVQLQSGTSFFTAFGQQGSQFAGVFGPQGAVIGAIIAIGSAVGGMLVNSFMGATEEVDKLSDALSEYKSLSDKIADSKSLSKEFGLLADEAGSVLEALKAIQGINISKQIELLGGIGKVARTTSKQVIGTGFMNLVPTFKELSHFSNETLKNAKDFLGVSGTVSEIAVYAGEYARAIERVQSADTLEEQAAAAASLSNFLKEHVALYGDEIENLDEINKLQEVLLGLMKATVVVADDILGSEEGLALGVQALNELFEARLGTIDDTANNYKDILGSSSGLLKSEAALNKLFKDSRGTIDDTANNYKDILGSSNGLLRAETALNQLYENSRGTIDKTANNYEDILGSSEGLLDAENALNELYEDRLGTIDDTANNYEDILGSSSGLLKAEAGLNELYEDRLGTIDDTANSYEDILGSSEGLLKAEAALNKLFKDSRGTIDDTANKYEDILGSSEGLLKAERALNELYEGRLGTIDDTANNYEDILGSEEGLQQGVGALNSMYEDRLDRLMSMSTVYDDILGSERGLLEAEKARLALTSVQDSGYAGGRGGDPRDFSNKDEFRKQLEDSIIEPDKVKKEVAVKQTDLEKLREQVNLETQLFGKSEARQKVMRALGVTMGENFPKTEAGLQAQIEKNLELIAIEEKRQGLIDSITGSVEDGMMAMIDGTISVKDAFKSMAAEIIKELYRVLVVQKIVAAAKLALGFADGGVVSGGSEVTAYANGGVVNGPTNFPMAGNKVGLMGEAGPEAIMPLKRGANGKLGVQAEGGGDSIVINQAFNFQANGDDSVKKLIAQAAPRIAELAKASVIESRRRGGSTKAAFN